MFKHITQFTAVRGTFVGLVALGIACGLVACGKEEAKPSETADAAKATEVKAEKTAAASGITVTSEKWGEADGKTINLYTLKNSKGMTVQAINWGAYITSVIVPDKNGNFEEVTIGYDTWEEYYNDNSYSGPIVGRFGNRIAKGKFTIDGVEYNVTRNNGGPNNDINQLHGGLKGLHKRAWDAKQVKNGVEMSYLSPDGEEGYPGNLNIKLTITLNESNELRLDYEATTDKKTPVNLTWHAYFNLSGNMQRDIEGHLLTMAADKTTPVDDTLIPYGNLASVEGTPFDFQAPTAIGKNIRVADEQLKKGGGQDKEYGGYDHNWVFSEWDGSLKNQVTLYDPESGRYMDIYTEEPAIQFYAGNFMDGSVKARGGKPVNHRYGMALEPQHFPDSPNHPNFPNTILAPGETYQTTSVYKFGVK